MALFTQAQTWDDANSQHNTSPFVTIDLSNQSETSASLSMLSGDFVSQMGKGTTKNAPQYTLRIQSSRFPNDNTTYSAHEINKLLERDLVGRITTVNESLAGVMFPDTAFGFPINDQFVGNFCGSFLSNGGSLDQCHFCDETTTATFLNKIISTIAHFLHATGQISLKPLRYFTAAYSNKPMEGHPMKWKPDIVLVCLIDGYLRDGSLQWHDVQALIEHTHEKKPPTRLAQTISAKSYLTFCSQPARDFVVSICIIGENFNVVMTDRVCQVKTELIPLDHTLVFLRMVMGLAFLPDSLSRVDETINLHDVGKSSSIAFADEYQPFSYPNPNPLINLLASVDNPSGDTSTPISPGFATISVHTNVYKVVHVIFKSQTLIGHATRVFLVQLPNGKLGVLKDSWITVDRQQEAKFLEGLNIPFGPELIDHCVL